MRLMTDRAYATRFALRLGAGLLAVAAGVSALFAALERVER
jgi:hypothetical protein